MNCPFCARGQAQNINISKEIIDKSFSEIVGTDTFIHTIRINGGEPFLSQDIIIYLFDQIISKKLLVDNIVIFTNGLIKPTKGFIDSINRVTGYLNGIEFKYKKMFRVVRNHFKNYYVYKDTAPYKAVIIISDFNRNFLNDSMKKTLNENYQVLSELQNDDFNIVKQSATFGENSKEPYEIEGNALKNFKQLLDYNKEYDLKDIRIIDNKYRFISVFNDYYGDILSNSYFYSKTLSISVNGNVFPGCLTSYENVDKNPMFNIMNCNGDFFEKVISWVWLHPLNEKMHEVRQLYLNYVFLNHNNYKISKDFNFDFLLKLELYNQSINEIEKIQKDIHPMLETLKFVELEVIALMIYINQMFERGVPINEIHRFLHDCTDLTENQIKKIDNQYCKQFIIDYTNIDKERKEKANEK